MLILIFNKNQGKVQEKHLILSFPKSHLRQLQIKKYMGTMKIFQKSQVYFRVQSKKVVVRKTK